MSFSSVAVGLFHNGMNFSLNSKIVVDTLNGRSIHNIEFGSIIQYCRQISHKSFYNSVVEFNRRQKNMVAHELTHATPLNTSFELFIGAPMCINDLLIDMNFFFRDEKI